MVGPDSPLCLRLDVLDDLGDGDAVSVRRRGGVAAKVADGLKVDATDCRGVTEAKVDDPADLRIVDARDEGGHEHNADAGIPAMVDGPLLLLI